MRLLILTIIIFGLSTCKQVSKLTTFDTSKSSQQVNDDHSTITTNSIGTKIKNVTYSTEFLKKDGESRPYIVRKTNHVQTAWGVMGRDSQFTVDILDIETRQLIRKFSMSADEITFSMDGYVHATLHECCGAENYYTFSKIWTDETFFQYDTKYYHVDIPNRRLSFYFGYVARHDEKDLTVGELYFVQRIPVISGAVIVDWRFKEANKVIFKSKTKEMFDTELPPFCPTMSLTKNAEKDNIINNEDYQELRLWSFDKSRGLKGISFSIMTLKFGNKEDIIFNIPIENGYLFGDSINYERTLYIGR